MLKNNNLLKINQGIFKSCHLIRNLKFKSSIAGDLLLLVTYLKLHLVEKGDNFRYVIYIFSSSIYLAEYSHIIDWH